jgi:hypothetical protein
MQQLDLFASEWKEPNGESGFWRHKCLDEARAAGIKAGWCVSAGPTEDTLGVHVADNLHCQMMYDQMWQSRKYMSNRR